MSEKHLIQAVSNSYKEMNPDDRVREIKELVSRSAEDAEFIRRNFPEFYEEAILPQPRAVGGCSGSGQRTSLVAKPR